MEFNNVIQLIEKSEYIGILLPKEAGFDARVATEVLIGALEEEGKVAGILNGKIDALTPPDLLPRLASAPLLPKDFVISLAAGPAEISQLRYEKTDHALDIIISPKRNSFKEQLVSFREGKVRCDLIFALGISDIESLNGSLPVHPEFFTETPLINIDVSRENKKYGEVSLIAEERASLSEMIYELLSAWREKPVESNMATLILAAIYANTKTLRDHTTHPDTILAASELIRIGAEHGRAQSLSHKGTPAALVQLHGRAAVRSKFSQEEGVLWSFLTTEDFEKTGRTSADIPHVLDALRESFPPHKLSVLLTQDAPGNPVAAALLGHQPLLAQIQNYTTAEFQSPHLQLTNTFSTFREAEEFISTILRHIVS